MSFKRAILITIDNDIYIGFQNRIGKGQVSNALEQYMKSQLLEAYVNQTPIRLIECPKCKHKNSDSYIYCTNCMERLIPVTINLEAEARRIKHIDDLMKDKVIMNESGTTK